VLLLGRLRPSSGGCTLPSQVDLAHTPLPPLFLHVELARKYAISWLPPSNQTQLGRADMRVTYIPRHTQNTHHTSTVQHG
jgi:hypothetical protein